MFESIASRVLLGTLGIACISGGMAFVGICRRLQARHPLVWARFRFPRQWLQPGVDDEGAQIEGQFKMLRYLFSNEYQSLGDGQLRTLYRWYFWSGVVVICSMLLLLLEFVVDQ